MEKYSRPQKNVSIDTTTTSGFDHDVTVYMRSYIGEAIDDIAGVKKLTRTALAAYLQLTPGRLSRLLKQLDLELYFHKARLEK